MSFKSKQTGKTYKNVYTILEKVKKGEIKTYYDREDGLFGKINFYKKPDLVKPYMHYIDHMKLTNIVDTYLNDTNNVKWAFEKFRGSTEYHKLAPPITDLSTSPLTGKPSAPDYEKFSKKFRENIKKFPDHLKDDIFKLYYHKMDDVEFDDRTDANYSKFKFLEASNNPVGKIMSESSNLKSSIFTRNILMFYIAKLTMLEYTDPEAAKAMKNSLSGGSPFDQGDIDKIMQDILGDANSKKMMDELIDQASDLCKKMDSAMSDELQEQLFDEAKDGGTSAGKLSADYFKQIAAKLETINFSMNLLKDKIKKLLDKSVSYFSSRKETVYEDLFNSDNVGNIEEMELLHPNIRKMFIEDINVRETKTIGKIDVYVDVSGSMSESCGVKDINGTVISKMQFAKSLIAKLINLNILNDVYVFNGHVKKYKNDIISVATIDADGGTNIDGAVKAAIRNATNCLFITDAEDCCTKYSEHVFFIGVKGAKFSHFNKEVLKQYSENNQVIIFDGNTIDRISIDGKIMK